MWTVEAILFLILEHLSVSTVEFQSLSHAYYSYLLTFQELCFLSTALVNRCIQSAVLCQNNIF